MIDLAAQPVGTVLVCAKSGHEYVKSDHGNRWVRHEIADGVRVPGRSTVILGRHLAGYQRTGSAVLSPKVGR